MKLITPQLLLVFLLAPTAQATPTLIEKPQLRSKTIQRTIRSHRRQASQPSNRARNSAQRKASIERKWDAQARTLAAMDVDSADFRNAISQEPLQVRFRVFRRLARAQSLSVSSFDRRFHGMLKNGKRRPPALEGDARPNLAALVAAGGFARDVAHAGQLIEAGLIKVNGRRNRNAEARVAHTAKVSHVNGAVALQKRYAAPKAVNHAKTVFEVTADTLDLFKKVMGGNVVWFNVASSPGHLHTLIADQKARGELWHDTYGTTMGDRPTMPRRQYSFPVVLTDHEMARFIEYHDAGAQAAQDAGRRKVYGFFSQGLSEHGGMKAKLITDMECTNWATSASIGDLPRWVRTVDKRIKKLARQTAFGETSATLRKGIYDALVKAGADEARTTLVQELLDAKTGSGDQETYVVKGWNRSSLKRLAKLFKRDARAFPKKPQDLLLRTSLARTIDSLGRSKDPAKFTWDLLLSRAVPVVAVFNHTHDANFAEMEFNMEIMGTVNAAGETVANSYRDWESSSSGLGIVPSADR